MTTKKATKKDKAKASLDPIEKEPKVESIFEKFQDNLASVKIYFNKFGTLAIGEDKSIVESFDTFFTETFSKFKEDVESAKCENDESKHKSKIDDLFQDLERSLKKLPKISPKNFDILSRGSFLMLNNYFEYLISDLLSYYYTKYSNSLNEKEFKVTLKELNDFDSLEDAKKQLIIKEVEGIIVEKSFDQLLQHFENKLSIPLENELINWDKIVEIRERRHLIVHNSSIVNKKYINRTKNPFKLKIGDTVHIDNKYFNTALKELKIAGQLLSFNCWGNWDKENIDSALEEIMMITFEGLKDEEHEYVCKLCEYSNSIIPTNESQEDNLLRVKFNHAISLKMTGKKDELNKLLKKIKIGTATPIFKIAHQILLDNHKDIETNLKNAILLEEINLDSYLEWPIFSFTRKNKRLNKKLIELFEN